MSAESRVANFGAGPSALPEPVLLEACNALLNFNGTGIGIAEVSHRSKEFGAYLRETSALIREQLAVPDTHHILFVQSGGTGQFSAIVLNLLARHRLLYPDLPESERRMDYVLSGSWSKAAWEEAKRLANGSTVNIAADSRMHAADGKSFDGLPPHDSYRFSEKPAFVFYCENETISGTQFAGVEGTSTSFPFHLVPKDTPLVADYSSSFMSRPIPRLADHAVIYAGAQKNLGPAGLTIVIVRRDCLVDVNAAAEIGGAPIPITMSWKWYADGESCPNTPPVFSVYVTGLVIRRNKELGGLAYYEDFNGRKQEKVYQALKEGEAKGVFKPKVKEGARSWMNVTFAVLGEGAEARFLTGAEKLAMKGLKGHRSVGGIRVSLYNAVTEEWTDRVTSYMREFIAQEIKTRGSCRFQR